jgi:MFS family permease
MFEPAPTQVFVRRPYYPWLVVGTVCLGTFIGQIDASIVQLALPSLEDAFGAPLDAVSWVALGYLLAFASVLPVFARMAEIAGRKTLYLSGFALFGLWSALCGLAPSLLMLIGFRVLQGMSGALLGANSVVILVAAAGPARRGRALLGWRWIFWVTVPFAVLGTALGWLIVPRTTTFSGDHRFDLPGAFLLVPALAALLLAISEFQAWGLSAPLIACAVAAPLLLGGFLWRETRAPAPLINLSLFRSAAFSAGSVGVLVSYGMLYGMFFAMSFALVRGYHDQPLAAGFRLTIVPVALGLVAPFSGALSDKRPRLLMLAGMAISVAAAMALTRLLDGTPGSLTRVMVGLAAFGVGLGFYIAPNNNATMSAAPADKSGVAGGLLNLLRALGGGVGVAASSVVLAWGLESATGVHERTAGAPEAALIAAAGDVLVLLALFGALGAAMAVIRNAPEVDGRKAVGAGAPKPL